MDAREARRYELLLEAGRLLSSKLDLVDLLTSVLELASRVVDAETASLLLLDEKTQELYFDVALGLGDEASKVRLKLGQGIAGAVARSRAGEIINDVRRDPRWSAKTDERSGFVTRSILAAPIVHQGRLLGVIEAINKRAGAFVPEDLDAFKAFASQAGVALENARLFSALREEKIKLATVFAQMRDGAVLADGAGRVVLTNGAARRLLGSELSTLPAALKGMAVVPELSKLLSFPGHSAAFTATRREPTLLVISGQATKVALADGERRLFVFRDDTEAARQETMKRSFLSLISHKLKTPLAAVIGYSNILLSGMADGKTDPDTLKAMRSVHAQSAKVGELVDKLLRYTVLESPDAAPKIEDFPADAAVAEALQGLSERIAATKAAVGFPASGLAVAADRALFVAVVKNLVENALKFDPGPAPAVTVTVTAGAGGTELAVADRGPGIPPEAQQAVFSGFHQVEKDFTGQVEGMGLGLPFVRKVAELHGGAATLRSKLGEGTTVTVVWPRRSGA